MLARVLLASSFVDTLGLVAVFFIVFPAVVTVLVTMIVVQVLGERRANQQARQEHAPGD